MAYSVATMHRDCRQPIAGWLFYNDSIPDPTRPECVRRSDSVGSRCIAFYSDTIIPDFSRVARYAPALRCEIQERPVYGEKLFTRTWVIYGCDQREFERGGHCDRMNRHFVPVFGFHVYVGMRRVDFRTEHQPHKKSHNRTGATVHRFLMNVDLRCLVGRHIRSRWPIHVRC